ncbi:MAG: Rv3654c family TadE-like protein [Jiangellaceae bacterium]
MRGRRIAGTERGAGSVLVLCGVMVVLMALLAVATLGGGYVARHRAAAAADFAALAAADQLRAGGAMPPCDEASAVAESNGGVLRSCTVKGWDVEVTVAVDVSGPTAWLADPVRRARAGPTAGELGSGGGSPDRTVPDAGWTLPVAGGYRITARFGDSGDAWSGGRHTGLDFAAPAGTPVVAAAGGRVVESGPAGRYGNLVTIDHGGVVSYYAHLQRSLAAAGDIVGPGEQLGTVGSTGNSTGPHLHFELRVGGVPRDPATFLGIPP